MKRFDGAPSEWDRRMLKHAFRFIYGDSLPASDRVNAGDIPVYGSNGVIGRHDRANIAGPAIVIGRKGSAGELRYEPAAAFVIDTAYAARPRGVDARWGFWLLTALDLPRLAAHSAVPGLSLDQLATVRVPVPPETTQRAIASFLDRETAKIETLIEKKRRLLDLLEEKGTALITRAVTRGLHPNVPMKDSGVEWIGEIPDHWEVRSLRRVARVVDCKHRTPTYVPEGYPLVSTTEVKPGLIDLSVCTRFVGPEDFSDMTEGLRLPTRGDIIYSRNASLGAAALVETEEPFCMGQDVVLIRTREHPDYLRQQLNSPAVTRQVEAVGVGSTFSRINVATIRDLQVILPPKVEQRRIAGHLRTVTAEIREVVMKVNNAIALLQEYRTAIISGAVAGRIRPSEVIAPENAVKLLAEII